LRVFRAVLIVALGAALVLPATALAQGTNPLSPGFPQPSVSVTSTTTAPPTITTTATAGGGSGFSGSSAIIIAIGALVVLGGISLYIWRDARRRAPVRHHAAAGTVDEGRRSGAKQRAKPRKLSPAERRRRKRGRAR
jgi:hypothetical protein